DPALSPPQKRPSGTGSHELKLEILVAPYGKDASMVADGVPQERQPLKLTNMMLFFVGGAPQWTKAAWVGGGLEGLNQLLNLIENYLLSRLEDA
ncbi:unnamed protein product, partial [Effrenium voratum]